MAIDYTPLQQDDVKFADIVRDQNITFDDLPGEVNRLYDVARAVLDEATDADIAYEPDDPEADDRFTDDEAVRHIGWTLGHLVAHITASNEEGAVFASLLARGISQEGRIRTETPWEAIDTVEKAVARLEESRRIVLAYLEATPAEPSLTTFRDLSERAAEYFGPVNAVTAMVIGLSHHNEHIAQMRETLAQSQGATEQA